MLQFHFRILFILKFISFFHFLSNKLFHQTRKAKSAINCARRFKLKWSSLRHFTSSILKTFPRLASPAQTHHGFNIFSLAREISLSRNAASIKIHLRRSQTICEKIFVKLCFDARGLFCSTAKEKKGKKCFGNQYHWLKALSIIINKAVFIHFQHRLLNGFHPA